MSLSTCSGYEAEAEALYQRQTEASFLRACRGPVGCLNWVGSVRVNRLYAPHTPQLPLPTKQQSSQQYPPSVLMAWESHPEAGCCRVKPVLPRLLLLGPVQSTHLACSCSCISVSIRSLIHSTATLQCLLGAHGAGHWGHRMDPDPDPASNRAGEVFLEEVLD